MKTVYSIDEARDWFFENHEGSVACVKDNGDARICKSYVEAKEFYKQDISGPNTPIFRSVGNTH